MKEKVEVGEGGLLRTGKQETSSNDKESNSQSEHAVRNSKRSKIRKKSQRLRRRRC